jgi:[ribosomal protein S18]-alanine N-acetyltransferase
MLEIERAGVKDHGIVTGLLLDFSETQGWTPEADRDRWDRVVAELLNSDSWLFLVAREEGVPVGLAAVGWYLTLYGSREQARLTALIVDAGHRRRGVGTALMESVIAAARRRGCRELEASAGPADESIVSFYRKFANAGERRMIVWPCKE